MRKKRTPDFAGWVTKNDILCSDGVVIRHGAFKDNDGSRVPLVWEHFRQDPKSILGHVDLVSRNEGTYGYATFNNTAEAQHAKQLVQHGDIRSMSIAANRIKKNGQNVIGGNIFEVSLVLSGANPGALIETVMTHNDTDEETAVFYNGMLFHTNTETEEDEDMTLNDFTTEEIEDILSEMTDDEIDELISDLSDEEVDALLDDLYSDDEELSDEEIEELLSYYDYEEDDEEEEDLKQHIFNKNTYSDEILSHSEQQEILEFARDNNTSLKEAMLEHGIQEIEVLFPEAKTLTNTPHITYNRRTGGQYIIDGVRKSPFANVKTVYTTDLTDEQARAKGYIKGAQKLDEIFELLTRKTTPQTIYKKQKLDRDDVVDITNFDVISFVNAEMKFMLKEELARAILVGDGRTPSSPDKIKAEHIRPILTDDDLFSIKKVVPSHDTLIEAIIMALVDYQGTAVPDLFIHPKQLAELKLMKKSDGGYLFGDIPSVASMAARLGVNSIVETTFLKPNQMILVHLGDYTVGANRGGEVTTFDDFDIDFNQHKYLIETRVSGALTIPKSAIVLTMSGSDVEGDEPFPTPKKPGTQRPGTQQGGASSPGQPGA